MVPFQKICPKLALHEERSIRIEGPSDAIGLPNDEYGLLESYCQERNCDCRRVILTVVSRHRNKVEATISFGFDPAGFMPGPFLDPLNRQGKYADEILALVASLLKRDRDYVARLKRHYQIAKDIQSGRLRPEDATPSFRLPAPQPINLTGPTSPASGSDRTKRIGSVRPGDVFDVHQNPGDEYDEERLRDELANPENFGMAKSFFRMGELAGFDMSTPEGLAAFTQYYNSHQGEIPGGQNRGPGPGAGRSPQAPPNPASHSPRSENDFPFDFGLRDDDRSNQERQSLRDARKRQRQAKKRNRR